jgi:hypothetical protein
MRTFKIKVGFKILRYKRFVNYRLKSNVPESMQRYIQFLVSHHNYSYIDMGTSKYAISQYFEPFLDIRQIN